MSQRSTVAGVLHRLCQQLELQCEVPAVPETQLPVAPMVIRGPLSQVLTKLFEGTELNFAAFPVASRKDLGRVIVQVRSRGTFSQPSAAAAVLNQPITNAPEIAETSIAPEENTNIGNQPGADQGEASPTVRSSQSLGPGSSITQEDYASTASSGPLPGVSLSGAVPGPPLPGLVPSGQVTTPGPLPGVPASPDRAPGHPLP